MSLPRLHIVTDAQVLARPRFTTIAESLLRCCGARCALHLRGHGMSGGALHHLGAQLAAIALRTGAWLLVNDRVDVAMAVRANGVQLGSRSLEPGDARGLLGAGAVIGVSAHSAAEVAQARVDGADFALLGNIYETRSHPERAPLGAAQIERAAEVAQIPIIAIGGITPERVSHVAQASAHGVAVLGGIWSATDPVDAAAAYVAAADAAWSEA